MKDTNNEGAGSPVGLHINMNPDVDVDVDADNDSANAYANANFDPNGHRPINSDGAVASETSFSNHRGQNATATATSTQPQVAFVANLSNNGGPLTGSLVYFSELSELTSPFSSRSEETQYAAQSPAPQPTTERPKAPAYLRQPQNGDQFLALLNSVQNQTIPPDYYDGDGDGDGGDAYIYANGDGNPEQSPSLVSPLTQPTTLTPDIESKNNDQLEDTNAHPAHVESFRTRRRKRAEQQKQAQNTQTQPQLHTQTQKIQNKKQSPVLPPHHRGTNTQVWNGAPVSVNGSAAQAFVFNGVPIVFTTSDTSPNPTLGQLPGQPNTPRHHHRTDTNMTLVSHDIISGGTTTFMPSVHFLQDGAEGLRRQLHDVVRNSRRIEIVNDEQIARVKMMHQRFSEGSKLSFNYNTLLLTASILAGLGLASNSSTTVIASMLVSPIMGPVVGMAYAATISDFRLFKLALRTELVSLLFCIAMGALLSACIGPTELAEAWPTDEMFTRGTWQNFLVALPVAFFSGLGVAVGLLDDQVSSLVGVAISASLLPPAVNSGLLWVSYAFFDRDGWFDPRPQPYPSPPTFDEVAADDNVVEDIILDDDQNDNIPEYTERSDFRNAGIISLSLTLANIVLVAVASMVMFRIKERLPIPSKKIFWEDLGVARKIYRNLAVMSYDDNSEVSSRVIDGNLSSSSSDKSDHPPDNQETMYGVRRSIQASIPEGNESENEDLVQVVYKDTEV